MILKATSRIARWGWLLFLPCFGCSRSHLPDQKKRFSLPVLFLSVFVSQVYADELVLMSDTSLATAGYYQLVWTGNSDSYELQESATADFAAYKRIYQGEDTATVMSGKADADYFYRVVDTSSSELLSSNTIKVTVAHHPLRTAWMFFFAGLVVFIATLILIIKGSRQHA